MNKRGQNPYESKYLFLRGIAESNCKRSKTDSFIFWNITEKDFEIIFRNQTNQINIR